MSKETFKLFARNHPELAYQVMDGKTNWQKLYELYEIYGEDSEIWSDYNRSGTVKSSELAVKSATTFKEFFNTFKNIDLESVQKGVVNIQKTIGLLQDIGLGGSSQNATSEREYEPRPMYKYFED